MKDVVASFCVNVHEKLETLQGRMESLKLNIGATYHLLREKIVEIRNTSDVRRLSGNEARATLEQWMRETRDEEESSTVHEIRNQEIEYLTARAIRAEQCVEVALMLAEASIDDAEWMILEAIAARRDAEAAAANG